MVSLLGWVLMRNVFREDPDRTAGFATRFFLIMTLVEIVISVGVIWAVYHLVLTGRA